LYKTLQAWGIGVRRSRLKPFNEFCAALRKREAGLALIEGCKIDDSTLNLNQLSHDLWTLVDQLDITSNNTRIVPGTKTLHHLLPDLVVPMDRAYTQNFFRWQNPEFQYNQKRCFEQAFVSFGEIARKTAPSHYINNRWDSSRTKVIDNALIGFVIEKQGKLHATAKDDLLDKQRHEPRDEVRASVSELRSSSQPAGAFSSAANWLRNLFVQSRGWGSRNSKALGGSKPTAR
jgi:hypothetical protein